MQEALFYISVALSAVALVLLIVKPLWGLMGIFFVRPLVDTTFGQPLFLDFKLTELVSSLVPLIIIARMLFLDQSSDRPFRNMPLKWDWVICSVDVVFFSSLIMFEQDWQAGLSVLMRHLNGFAGFYMVQAYCRNKEDFLKFAWAMALAGIFPMATGVWEAVTGQHWAITTGANDVVRNIGLYHDAITIRWYSQQTIIAVMLIAALSKRSVLIRAFSLCYGLVAAFVLKGAVSKSGSLTLLLWIVFWPLLRRSVKGIIALSASLVILAVYFSKEIMDSFGFVFSRELQAVQGGAERETTLAGRWEIWEEMAKQWESYTVFAKMFGSGHMANGAHNDYLQVLFHGGYIGLMIYVFLLGAVGWSILRDLLKRADIWAIASSFVFIMWLIDTIGLIPSAYSGYQWFAWGVIGFCLRYRRDEQKRAQLQVEPAELTRRFPNLLGAT